MVWCTVLCSILLHFTALLLPAVTCISILSCSLDAQEEREEAEAAQAEEARRELAKQMEEAATRIMEGRRKENVEKVVHCYCLAASVLLLLSHCLCLAAADSVCLVRLNKWKPSVSPYSE